MYHVYAEMTRFRLYPWRTFPNMCQQQIIGRILLDVCFTGFLLHTYALVRNIDIQPQANKYLHSKQKGEFKSEVQR